MLFIYIMLKNFLKISKNIQIYKLKKNYPKNNFFGNNNNNDDYLLMLFATYLSYYYQK